MAVRLLRFDGSARAERLWEHSALVADTTEYTGPSWLRRKLQSRLGFTFLESPFRQPSHAWLDDAEVTEKLRELFARPPANRRGRSAALVDSDL